jgi:tRNA threonylcarbamoyladenosine biosynthesis protein TsaB
MAKHLPGSGCARCLLALDAAGAACSAAVWRDGQVAARRFAAMGRGQSEHLLPMIEAVMAEAAVDYEALEAVAVTVGPGGFTGVRIGLAAARGLALAWRTPLIGISNFAAVAAAVPVAEGTGRTLAVVLDSKRHESYVQAFAPIGDGPARPLGPGAAVAPDELDAWLPAGPVLLAGDGLQPALAVLQAVGRDARAATSPGWTDAAQVARLAAAQPLPGPQAPPPRPLYLRAPDVTVPTVNPPNASPPGRPAR